MEEEIWKVYKDTRIDKRGRKHNSGALWEVSNLGRVKKNGKLYNSKGINNPSGYAVFAGTYLHRAVAELFIPNPENKTCIDHIDTNKYNNRAENLRWVTPKENSNNPLTRQLMSTTIKEYRSKHQHPMKGRKHKKTTRRQQSISHIGIPSANKGKHRVYDNKELNIYHYE